MVAAFCLGYGRLGRWLRNSLAAVAGALVVAAGAFSIASAIRSTWVAGALVGVVVLIGLATWPPAVSGGVVNPYPYVLMPFGSLVAIGAAGVGLCAIDYLAGPLLFVRRVQWTMGFSPAVGVRAGRRKDMAAARKARTPQTRKTLL